MGQIQRCDCLISFKIYIFIDFLRGSGNMPDPLIFYECAKIGKNVPAVCDGKKDSVNGVCGDSL